MARTPNKKKDEAERLYKDGERPVDIAKKLNIPQGTIRRWKSEYNWGGTDNKTKRTQSEHSDEKTSVRKRGGQPGNTNNFKHGIYQPIYYDTLTEDEKELISTISDNTESMLKEEINLLSLRERRLMSKINYYNRQWDVNADSMVTVKAHNSIAKNDMNDSTVKRLDSEKTDAIFVIEKIEAELTRVQKQKTKCIEILAQMRSETDTDNTEHTEINIYMPDNGRDKGN